MPPWPDEAQIGQWANSLFHDETLTGGQAGDAQRDLTLQLPAVDAQPQVTASLPVAVPAPAPTSAHGVELHDAQFVSWQQLPASLLEALASSSSAAASADSPSSGDEASRLGESAFGFLADARPAAHVVEPARLEARLPGADEAEQLRLQPLSWRSAAAGPFDANSLRADFPALHQRVHGKPLIWLDNAATTHKPRAVIERLARFYEHDNSNVHRGAHALAARATDAYEGAREKVRRFINAASAEEMVFVRGTTEAINLVAKSWGAGRVGPGDEIVISWLEHHANIVPWQQLCAQTGARLRVIPVDDDGQILLDEYERLLNHRTRIVSVTMVSNALGTVTPVHEIVHSARRRGIATLVDAAQSAPHMRLDVQALGCDFLALSGHKMFAPTGIGALYGRAEMLDAMPPWQGGGNMIEDVTFERTRYQSPPQRFEAGTGNIADAVGLGAAIDYLERVGLEAIARHEHELLARALEGLTSIPGLRLVGTTRERAGVISFVLDGWTAQDVGRALDAEGIAVRAGHHCAQPILRRFGVEASVRPSVALYNNFDDIDALVAAVQSLSRG